MLDEFSALASGVDSAINLMERVRDVGVQVVVAAQSVEGWVIIAKRPGCWPPAPAGSWCSSAPTPSGCWPWPVRYGCWSTTGSWTSTALKGSPRPGWGSGPGSTPRRSARPSPVKLGDPGRSDHPPARPATAGRGPEPVDLAVTLPRIHDTLPLPVEQPAPIGIAAAVALAGRAVRRAGQRAGRRRERAGGCLPRPAGRGWSVAPCPVGGGDESPARTGLPASLPCGDPAPAPARPVACWTGCHLAAARVKGAAVLAALRSSRPCGTAYGGP